MKKLITTILSLLALESFGQFELSQHLVGSYPLNGNGLDFSGNGNNLTLQNVSQTFGMENTPNTGYLHQNFNSTISTAHFNLIDSISICAWIKPTDSLQSAGIFYNGFSGTNGYGIFFKKHLSSTQLGSQLVLVRGGIAETLIDENYYLPRNQWTHITLVIKQNSYKIYINGARIKSGLATFNSPNGLFSIGSPIEHINNGYPAFKGTIDNILVVNFALDSTKISEIINNNTTQIKTQKAKNEEKYFEIKNNYLIENHEKTKEIKLYSIDGKILNGRQFYLQKNIVYLVKILTIDDKIITQKIML